MQIIEKPWEKINIGANAVEYIFSREDGEITDWDKVCAVMTSGDYDYRIARVPANEMGIVQRLHSYGFQFIEATTELKCSLRNYEIPKQYEKYIDSFRYEEVDENGIEFIYSEIMKGLYTNDRIALDPVFSLEKSSRRFRNWLQSEVKNKTSKVFMVYFGETKIGYFAVKNISPREFSSIHAALFKEWKDSGLGFSTLLFPIIEAKSRGKRIITTAVSTNNLISVKTHMSVGYQLTDIKYVFSKHE